MRKSKNTPLDFIYMMSLESGNLLGKTYFEKYKEMVFKKAKNKNLALVTLDFGLYCPPRACQNSLWRKLFKKYVDFLLNLQCYTQFYAYLIINIAVIKVKT